MESLPVSFVCIETQSLLHFHLLAIFSVRIIRQLHWHAIYERLFGVCEPSVFVPHLYPVELDHIQWHNVVHNTVWENLALFRGQSRMDV